MAAQRGAAWHVPVACSRSVVQRGMSSMACHGTPSRRTRPYVHVSLYAHIQRYTNGVVSNGVVSKKTDLQMVAKPAPEIFRMQGTYHNNNKQTHNQGGINRPYLELWRDKPALLIRPDLVRPGLCCSKRGTQFASDVCFKCSDRCSRFSVCACHPFAGAMLIFSVSFQS